jgi:hypothetical protein
MDLYKNDADAALHLRAIEAIAAEHHHPVDHVKLVYEAELSRLKSTARIDDFLATFTRRQTLDRLQRTRHG